MSYLLQAQAGLRMIASAGVAVPLTQRIAGTHDAVNQTSTPATLATQTVMIVILPATTSRDMTIDARALVRKNERLLYIAALKADGSTLDFEPADEQTISFENATWRLSGVSRLGPNGGAPALFTAEACK